MRCPRFVPLRSGRAVIGRSPASPSKSIQNVSAEDRRSGSPPAAPSDRRTHRGNFGRVWDCGERKSGIEGRGCVGDRKEQAVGGREGYTVHEWLFVLDWPTRRKRTRSERWLHARHVYGIQTFPPSFFFSLDGTTILWNYKIRSVGVMHLLLSSSLQFHPVVPSLVVLTPRLLHHGHECHLQLPSHHLPLPHRL